MLIYRMENDEHLGPFNAEVPGEDYEEQEMAAMFGMDVHMLIDDIIQDALDHKDVTLKAVKHITELRAPIHDGIKGGIRHNEACACISLDQVHEWFPLSMERAMNEHKQFLHVYEVPDKDVRIGGHQVVVKKCDLISKNEVSLAHE